MTKMNVSDSTRTLESAAPTAFRTAVNILSSWSCNRDQVSVILGISKPKIYRYSRNPNKTQLNYDQCYRISYVLNIYQLIREMFNNPNNIDNFMLLTNHNGLFNGRRPIDLLLEGSIESIRDTYIHLTSLHQIHTVNGSSFKDSTISKVHMSTKSETERHVIEEIKAIEDALADVRLAGLKVPVELIVKLLRAVQNKDITVEDLIAEYDKYDQL